MIIRKGKSITHVVVVDIEIRRDLKQYGSSYNLLRKHTFEYKSYHEYPISYKSYTGDFLGSFTFTRIILMWEELAFPN